jgi:membrane protease subunit HflC
MKLSLAGGAIAVLLLLAAIVGYSTLFTVDQTSQALVVRLGQPVRVITDPGLNVKVPFIDSVIYIDKRILNIESPAQEVIASSQDNSNLGAQAGSRLVVDAYARYRITDPLKFYQTIGPAGASSQLAILLNSALRRVLGGATLADVVRDKREELMALMRDQLDRDAQPFGIHVIDVRIRRADLPEQNSQAVYQRMQTERQREAAEFRAQGSQKSQEIKAKADRDVTVLLADATNQSEQVRGQGDAVRNRIFADAYTPDPDFFAFYRCCLSGRSFSTTRRRLARRIAKIAEEIRIRPQHQVRIAVLHAPFVSLHGADEAKQTAVTPLGGFCCFGCLARTSNID